MRDKKLHYKLNIFVVAISIVGFLGSLISALIIREKQFEYVGWFIAAGIFLTFCFSSIYFLLRFIKTEDYKNILKNNRDKSLTKAKTKNKIKEYFLKGKSGNLSLKLENILHNYISETLDIGKIYYKVNVSDYNKKEKSSDIFFLLNENIFNTFDTVIEKERLKKYCSEISGFLYSKGLAKDFINCIIIFQHYSMKEEEKDFYYTFTGLWDADMNGNKFIKNLQFTYCGADNSTNEIFFFKPLSVDGGTEVDLNYLITRELVQEK